MNINDIIDDKTYTKIWKKADDVIRSSRPMSFIYDNVPEELADIEVDVLEIHSFPADKREALLAWVNEED